QRVLEIFDTQPAISDELSATPATSVEPPGAARDRGRERKPGVAVASSPAQYAVGAQHGTVRYEHVRFSYPGATEAVLRDINLQVERGETLVLAGATGSGKTT